jgi:integrase/recombinase XerD
VKLRQRQTSRREMSHRVIPQEVLKQLKAYLESFPAHFQGMVIILVESGMRVKEVCSLPFDCLLQDEAGNWFLRYPQLKTQQEHTIPLLYRAAAVIREQQQAVTIYEQHYTLLPCYIYTCRSAEGRERRL